LKITTIIEDFILSVVAHFVTGHNTDL